MQTYLEPTQDAGRYLLKRGISGEIIMLNSATPAEVANYAANPELAPAQPITGAEAYDRYIAHTFPYLIESGGDFLFLGEGGPFLIGPEGERWDRALLVKQSSVQAFMAFSRDTEYLAGLGHRTAAVEDARLLPLDAKSRARQAILTHFIPPPRSAQPEFEPIVAGFTPGTGRVTA